MRETLYIRFDWAIKRLLRHKADFVVVEGFLSSLLGYSVTITDVLESESNRDAADDKANCVDVLVKDEKGVKILIEIQNEFERDFFQRMLYGTSKLVTQYLTRGGEYGQIGKIYSVNIVYFSLGDGQDYVYRGRTDFRGIHTHDTLKLSARQRAVFLGEEAGDVFPEYFVLRVNDFDQAAVTPLDEWIRFLKTEEIPEGSKAPGLAEARERLIEARLTPEERLAYERAVHYRRIKQAEYHSALEEGLAKGEAKGRVEGRSEGRAEGEAGAKLAIARNLLGLGLSAEQVSSATELPVDEIRKLKSDCG